MFSKGSLVIYKNQPAVIAECGDKFTINFVTGPKMQPASQNVRAKDIVLLHKGPVSDIKAVVTFAQTLQEQAQDYRQPMQEAYELYGEDDSAVALSELAELVFGDFEAPKAWAYYCFLKNSFLFEEKSTETDILFCCRSKEQIEILEKKSNEKDMEESLRRTCVEHIKAKQPYTSDDAKYMQEVEALALGKTAKSRVLKEAGLTETDETAHKVLLDCQFWPYYKNPFPSRWGVSMQSANQQLSHPPAEERLTIEHTAFAIDNSWSADPDDAVAFDGEYLWVHIADPASTVLPDSAIDIAARNRGSTLYIPEGAARMLAEESLADYALGLEEWSNALSFRIKLDENNAIADTNVFKTRLKVKRLTYEEASEMCDSPDLAPLFRIAIANEERRKKAGAVSITLPEVHINIEKGEANAEPKVSFTTIKSTKASEMVREMMLLAGEGAARFAFKNNIPFPYVSQDAPDLPKELPEGLAGQYRLRRSMHSRSVGITPSMHSGLGIGMYSQVTSPLRRYSDLVAHQQLRGFIDGKPLLDKDTVLERISAGDAASGAAVKAERKSNLHWTLCFLYQNPQWEGTGIVVELKEKTAVVLIPELAMETQIALNGKMQLNQELNLKVSKIDIPKQLVNFLAV